jgi:alanine-alpha-ketoisovalerate/valine-pyruvate aminotransferase
MFNLLLDFGSNLCPLWTEITFHKKSVESAITFLKKSMESNDILSHFQQEVIYSLLFIKKLCWKTVHLHKQLIKSM